MLWPGGTALLGRYLWSMAASVAGVVGGGRGRELDMDTAPALRDDVPAAAESMDATAFFFLHDYVDARLPSGFVTVPRTRRQLPPLAQLRRRRPVGNLGAAAASDALVPSSSSSSPSTPTPSAADDVAGALHAPSSPLEAPAATTVATEAALVYAVVVEDSDEALASVRRRALERLASVRSHRFQARVAELMAVVRQALPLGGLAAFQRHIDQLTALLQSVVVPLGQLRLGRPEEMALLFKVLCDDAGVDCRLIRGRCSDAPTCSDYAWVFVRDDSVLLAPDVPQHWLLVDIAAGTKYACPSVEAEGYTAEGSAAGAAASPPGHSNGLPGTEAAHARPFGGPPSIPAVWTLPPHGALTKAHLPPVHCSCGEPEEVGLMIECAQCRAWSHAACRGLDRKSAVPLDFTCWRCSPLVTATLVAPAATTSAEGPLRVRLVLRAPAPASTGDESVGAPSTPNRIAAALPSAAAAAAAARRRKLSGQHSLPNGQSGRRWSAGTLGLGLSDLYLHTGLGLPSPPETPDRPSLGRRHSRDAGLLSMAGEGASSGETSPLLSPLFRRRDSRDSRAGSPGVDRTRRRRGSAADFDIDNIVATGFSKAACIKPLEVKPVFTPGWHVVPPDAQPERMPVDGSPDVDPLSEDDSDAHYARLHAPFEHAEQRRQPIVVTQARVGTVGVVRTVSAAALDLPTC